MRVRQMAHLIKIGNSQGIRIPKPLIEQAQLQGKELKLELVAGGLLITPESAPRAGWDKSIEQAIEANGAEPLDQDWLETPLESDKELEW